MGCLARSRTGPLVLVVGAVVLGFVVYRIDRDQPLWLRPHLWGASRPRTVIEELPPLVLTFHYPWYGTSAGPTGRWRKWNHSVTDTRTDQVLGFHDPARPTGSGRLDIGAAHYPVNGPYDSRDPAVIRRQIQEARAAGLDGFIVSWWGLESEEDLTFRVMLDVAAHEGFLLTIYYETGELWRRGGRRVATDLEAVLDRYGSHPAFLRVQGTPVIFLYAVHRLRIPVWEYILRRLHTGGRRAVLIGDSIRQGWLERFDGLHYYSPLPFLVKGTPPIGTAQRWSMLARHARLPFAAAVSPGFDDRTIRRPGALVERRDGALYEETWHAALSVEPDWVLVSSWNEWHEGTEVEPSVEYGDTYLTLTRRWVRTFRGDRLGSQGFEKVRIVEDTIQPGASWRTDSMPVPVRSG